MIKENTPKLLAPERTRVIELVRKWGDMNTDGVLEDSSQIFTCPGIEGLIGYKVASSNAVVFGDPVCAPLEQPALAVAFQEFCRSKGLGVVYTINSQEFATWASENLNASTIEFGEKFIFDPLNNPVKNTGSKAVLVRKKVKHALIEGISVQEYFGHDPNIERQIEDVAANWLNRRTGAQVYLSHVSLFKDCYGKRWFYAQQGNRIIGLLMISQMQVKNGWLLNHVMMVKDAPSGLSELLVISVLQALEKENCRYTLAGPAPADQIGSITGVGNFKSTLIRWSYRGAKMIFHLSGHATFWKKFQPKTERVYLIFPHNNLCYMSVKALFCAFNVGKP